MQLTLFEAYERWLEYCFIMVDSFSTIEEEAAM